jgi:hypothetical protein
MLFDGQELKDILSHSSKQIELRNEYDRCYKTISASQALSLDVDQFIGIGNRRRIRFLRLRTQKFMLNAGSHTTQRLKGADGKNIAHPMIREPRDV